MPPSENFEDLSKNRDLLVWPLLSKQKMPSANPLKGLLSLIFSKFLFLAWLLLVVCGENGSNKMKIIKFVRILIL